MIWATCPLRRSRWNGPCGWLRSSILSRHSGMREEPAKHCMLLNEHVPWHEHVPRTSIDQALPMRPREQLGKATWYVAAPHYLDHSPRVAMEIRPAVLQASSAAHALGVVTSGLIASIAHLNGSKPLF